MDNFAHLSHKLSMNNYCHICSFPSSFLFLFYFFQGNDNWVPTIFYERTNTRNKIHSLAELTAPNDQQDPQLSWFFTCVTYPFFIQSMEFGRLFRKRIDVCRFILIDPPRYRSNLKCGQEGQVVSKDRQGMRCCRLPKPFLIPLRG